MAREETVEETEERITNLIIALIENKETIPYEERQELIESILAREWLAEDDY